MWLINLNKISILILLSAVIMIWSCSSDDETSPLGPEPTTDLTADCIGCHTNEALLRATAIPDEAPSGDPSGEG
jgi:hypothetical protein